MKRMISILLAVLMLVSLCACGAAPAAPAEPAPAEPAVQATEPAADPYADMEPVVFNIATSYKEGSDYINTLQAACDVIAEKTNGKVSFVICAGQHR